MVHIPTEVFAHAINQRVERWVAGGIALDAERDGDRWTMRFGRRWRIRSAFNCAAFGCICSGALALELAGIPLGFWLRLGYAGFMFPVLLLSVYELIRACATSVVLCDADVTVSSWPLANESLEWSRIATVRYSKFRGFLLQSVDGRRIRVSKGMNGLRTFVDFLIRLEPGVIHASVPIEMVQLLAPRTGAGE